MDNNTKKEIDLYKDIQTRTGGEIYIGVVGPVRTGKSTFIKHFMDECVLPNMKEDYLREQIQDELPQSAAGKTIMTTEPKFIPMKAAEVEMADGIKVKLRLIDCVGYMVQGASGHMENEAERMVRTPWSAQEIPFTRAAEIGTDKVIRDHSTIGIVVTTDGSFGELPREAYLEAEERTVQTLKKIHKTFLVLLNTIKPYAKETKELAKQLHAKYNVTVLPENCEQLQAADFQNIMQEILYEFPVSRLEFFMPKWIEMLTKDQPLKAELISKVKDAVKNISTVRDLIEQPITLLGDYIKRCKADPVNLADGSIRLTIEADDAYYYEMLSNLMGEPVANEYQLLAALKEYAARKKEYEKVENALSCVRCRGYGVVTPNIDEITLEKPELIRHGNKYGVKIKAYSPSIHLIRANIETEIAPIVGTEKQANDLIHYIADAENGERGIWETNIFGKTVEQLVNDGITGKIALLGEECQVKLQDTMQKIVNDTNGGLVCIII
ncbi:MAG: stage IV sporulation protein A [Lachnospiraceae bacterium]|nr:stage IV sporulation protein A [Lachnospiraceae bacterium]